jgi:hypothetical protein
MPNEPKVASQYPKRRRLERLTTLGDGMRVVCARPTGGTRHEMRLTGILIDFPRN